MPSDTSSIFIEHRGTLVNYATRLVGSRAQAEDLVQKAWLRLDAAAAERVVQEQLLGGRLRCVDSLPRRTARRFACR